MHLSPNNSHLPPVWAQPKKIPHKHPHGRNSAHPIDITPNNSSKARGIQPENLLKKVLPFPLKHKANSTLRNSSNKNPNNRVWKPKKNPTFLIARNYKQPSSISATSEYHKNRTRDTEISILSPLKKKIPQSSLLSPSSQQLQQQQNTTKSSKNIYNKASGRHGSKAKKTKKEDRLCILLSYISFSSLAQILT